MQIQYLPPLDPNVNLDENTNYEGIEDEGEQDLRAVLLDAPHIPAGM